MSIQFYTFLKSHRNDSKGMIETRNNFGKKNKNKNMGEEMKAIKFKKPKNR